MDANDRGARDYIEAIAHHPRLESLILPIIRHRMDGMAISAARQEKGRNQGSMTGLISS
jgi:hypothetical protein